MVEIGSCGVVVLFMNVMCFTSFYKFEVVSCVK